MSSDGKFNEDNCQNLSAALNVVHVRPVFWLFPIGSKVWNRWDFSFKHQRNIARRRESSPTWSTSVSSLSSLSRPSSLTFPPSAPYSGHSANPTTPASSTATSSWWMSTSWLSTVPWTCSGASPGHRGKSLGKALSQIYVYWDDICSFCSERRMWMTPSAVPCKTCAGWSKPSSSSCSLPGATSSWC